MDKSATTPQTVPTLKDAIERYLTTKQNQVGENITAGRWDVLQRHLRQFGNWAGAGAGAEVSAVNEQLLADYHSHLLTRIKHKEISAGYGSMAYFRFSSNG